NNGTTNWTAGQFTFSNGDFENNSSFNAPLNNSLASGGGTNLFNNNASGTFTRNTGTGTLTVGIPFNNAGIVNASTGTLAFNGGFTQTAGQTVLNGGDISTSSTLNIQGGILQGAGTVTGNVTSGGTVAPGLSSGILNIAGNYVQTAGGTLSIEINGIAVGTQYDQLNVTGTITLAGTLAVSSGFVSTPGNTFVIGNNNLADAVSGT